MATKTSNLNLTKYDYSDVADIAPMNNNMDIIDREVANRSKLGHKHKMSDIEGLSLQAENVTIKDTSNLFDSNNVEGALKELFTNVSSGKSSIAQAITAKGVPASASDSFATLANKISQIISALLNIPFPNFNIGIGTVDATFDTLDSTFKEFRIQGQSWQTSNVFRGLKGNSSYVFEAKYGGNRVSTLSLVTPKANQAKPASPTASNIKGDSITITAPIGCMIRFNGNNFNSPHTFTNLNINTTYEFYSFVPGTNKLNESPLSNVLRVQTLDIKKLFNGVDTSLELGSKDKFATTMMTGQSGGISIKENQLVVKMLSGLTETVQEDYLIVKSKAKLDLSKFSKLVVNVSSAYLPDYKRSYSVGVDNYSIPSTTIKGAGKYEVDISTLTSEKLTINLMCVKANSELQLNISEIYLTN